MQPLLIYNLFPTLLNDYSEWPNHAERIKEMGFNWVYMNPFHKTGYSKSLYSVKEYHTIDERFTPSGEIEPVSNLQPIFDQYFEAGLDIMIDIVINHTAIDCPLTEDHPNWYKRYADTAIMHPSCYDDQRCHRIFWYDLAQLDYHNEEYVHEVIDHWVNYFVGFLKMGARGFRCDAAYMIPGKVWKQIIDRCREVNPNAYFIAETIGCSLDQTLETADSGFDAIFTSYYWWDYKADWFPKEFNRLKEYSQCSFPENHDTPRHAQEELSDEENRLGSIHKYALALFISDGAQITSGYEYGYTKRLHVRKTTPKDWVKTTIDISGDLKTMHKMYNEIPLFRAQGKISAFHYEPDLYVVHKFAKDKEAVLFWNQGDKSQTVDLNELIKERLTKFKHYDLEYNSEDVTGPELVVKPNSMVVVSEN